LADFLDALKSNFAVEPVASGLIDAVNTATGCAIGVAHRNGGRYLLRLTATDRAALLGTDHGDAWRALDVAVLHRAILERTLGLAEGAEFAYEPNVSEALGCVERGEKDLAFLLKGTPPEQILQCCEAGEFMPQKSTYLFPKLPSGGVMHLLA
jgi:uncharacterized protein (DUF1015 family)